MGLPVVTVAKGGLAVSDAGSGWGMPVTEATNGRGLAVTRVAAGGMAVSFGISIVYTAVLSPVPENTAVGTTIGNLSMSGGTGTYTYTLTSNPGSLFSLTGSTLKTAAALNYEMAHSHLLTVSASNGVDAAVTLPLQILVGDIGPAITNVLNVSVPENQPLSITLTQTGGIGGVTWFLFGGSDLTRFALSGANTVTWAGGGTKDYDNPNDSNLDNVYQLQVAVQDSTGETDDEYFYVTVTNVVNPVITSATNVSMAENLTAVLTCTANESVTWTVSGGADAAKFSINSSTGALAFLVAPDYDVPTDTDLNNIYLVTVTATSVATGETTPKTMMVTITDVLEASPPAAPTIAWTTAATVNPPSFTVTAPSGPDLAMGDTIHMQRSTVSDFSSGITDFTNAIDAIEDAANAATMTSGAWATATPFWVRSRTERPVDGPSLWSNVLAVTISAGTSLKTGMVSMWEFTSGGLLVDSHGSNTLSVGGGSPAAGTSLITGGNSLECIGRDDWLTRASNSSLEIGPGQDFSFVFWMTRTASFDEDIFCKSVGGAGNQEWLFCTQNDGVTGRRMTFYVVSNTSSIFDFVYAPGVCTANTTFMYAATYTAATGLMTMSTNAGTRATFTSTIGMNMGAATAAPFKIGFGQQTGAGFEGKIDQIAFLKRAISTTEEADWYNGGAGRTYASL